MTSLERWEESSVMRRHLCPKHVGNVLDFAMNVTGTFRKERDVQVSHKISPD